jgi:hypothetical protein
MNVNSMTNVRLREHQESLHNLGKVQNGIRLKKKQQYVTLHKRRSVIPKHVLQAHQFEKTHQQPKSIDASKVAYNS